MDCLPIIKYFTFITGISAGIYLILVKNPLQSKKAIRKLSKLTDGLFFTWRDFHS